MSGINSGFNLNKYGPPLNLGPSAEQHFSMKVYSEIWGRDPLTGKAQEYDVNFEVATIGRWCFMHVDECIHPAHPMRPTDKSEMPEDGKDGYYYDFDAATEEQTSPYQWDYVNEVTGRPDQIHFSKTLPAELVEKIGFAKEYSIPIEVIKIADTDETIRQMFTGTEIKNGKLVITDTGEMEIKGDYIHYANYKRQLPQGQIVDLGKYVYDAETFDCGRSDTPHTKISKAAGDPTTGFYIGFKAFCLIFYSGGTTYGDLKAKQEIDDEMVPDVGDVRRSYINRQDRNLISYKDLISKFNSDKTLILKNGIKCMKEKLNAFKNYYNSLTKEERIEQISDLYKSLKIYANKFDKFDEYFKIEDYLPVKDDDSDGIPDHDEYGNDLIF